jgi:hypothetical protein
LEKIKKMYCNAPDVIYCKQTINRNYDCSDCKHVNKKVDIIDRIGLSKFYKIIENYCDMIKIRDEED